MVNKIIRPMRKKCNCGDKVISHHFLCNKCWGKKCKKEEIIKRKKLLKNKNSQVIFVDGKPISRLLLIKKKEAGK